METQPAGLTQSADCEQENSQVTDREAGLVTAEYAVGIVTAVAFAGLLLAIIRSDNVRQMLLNIIDKALGASF